MNRSRSTITLTILAAVSLACAPSRGEPLAATTAPEESAAATVLQRVVEAFNEGETETLAGLVSEDFEYYTITDDGAVLETRGRDAFQTAMIDYFASWDSVETRFEATLHAGPFVAIRETVRWSKGDHLRGQSSLAVYEIRDGEIVRAWYYPAYRMMAAMP